MEAAAEASGQQAAGGSGTSESTATTDGPTLFFEKDDGSTSSKVPVLLTAEERVQVSDTCAPLAEDYSWRDLFSRDFLPLTLTFGVMEVAYNMAFYVIIFSAGKLSDQVGVIDATNRDRSPLASHHTHLTPDDSPLSQLLLNLVLLAAADLPGSTGAGFLCDRIGPKATALGFLAGASATLFAFAVFEGAMGTDTAAGVAASPWLLELAPAALSLLGKSLCSGAFTAIFLLFGESYPVTLRSAALGSGNMFGKLGASCASPLTASFPLATTLGIAGVALLAGATSATTLPDSRAQQPPDT